LDISHVAISIAVPVSIAVSIAVPVSIAVSAVIVTTQTASQGGHT
jgi:hypothetical protein